MDAEIFGEDRSKLGAAASRHEERLRACTADGQDLAGRHACFLMALLGSDGLAVSVQPRTPWENTVSAVLTEGRGTCAALIATVLALTEPVDDPFEAVVLRDHALLTGRADLGVYYEVLDGGRALSEGELRRYEPHPPGGPFHVGGRGFVAYYLDNLAARLAQVGEDETADQVFRRALERDSRAARIHYNYGTFLLRSDRDAEALDHLERAIRLGWKDADAFVNRGAAKWKLGRIRSAWRDFRKALKLDPSNRRAATNLRQLDEAIAESD